MESRILVVAEKPSVAQSLAKVLGAYRRHDGYLEGSGYIVSWCYGHLAEYAMPEAYDERYAKWRFEDLPIIPVSWKLELAKDKRKQVEILRELLRGEVPVEGSKAANREMPVDYVVNACDAGREGELIFRHVYELARTEVPIKRLWISSMEDEAIREGFAHLKDGKAYENLYVAAMCRARADWIVGMNATRGFTTTYGSRITVGRVQSPTLAMIVERQQAIDNFKKTPYYKVTVKGSGIAAASENIVDEAEADRLLKKCDGKAAVITRVEKQSKRENPPKLYDLTSLQRDANRFFGYTAQQTLDLLQELYEEKMVTYPRTDSRYITSDMENSVAEMMVMLADVFPVAGKADEQNVQRLICDNKVTDHHAILPTRVSMDMDIGGLEDKKRNIYLMVATRLAASAAGVKRSEKTVVEVTCEGNIFTAKGTSIIAPGYSAVEEAFLAGYVKPKKAEEVPEDISVITILDEVFEGMKIEHPVVEKSMHYTTPPKPFTEDTLLAAMEKAGSKEMDEDVERKGLGTPATRAGVIEKLVSIGYVRRKSKQLLPTDRGQMVVSVLPEKMKSAELTAEWENTLLDVERGIGSGDVFLANIFALVDDVLLSLGNLSDKERMRFAEQEAIGMCPACGKPVVAGRGNYHCLNKDCLYVLWEEPKYLESMKGRIDREMAVTLVNEGRANMSGLYSRKTGKEFDAVLVISIGERGRVSYSLEFPKRRKRKDGVK